MPRPITNAPPSLPASPLIDRLIDLAIEEDLGQGDITSLSCVAAGRRGRAKIVARVPMVLSGAALVGPVLERIDPKVAWRSRATDGQRLRAGAVVIDMEGAARSLLAAERLLLNFMMHLSGIATHTAAVKKANPALQILDTRKTRPGLRVLEKYAVACGGGLNHRFSLGDGILIKDNHRRAGGGVAKTIAACRAAQPYRKIEVEVETAAELKEAIKANADIIMLDNFPDAELPRLLKQIPPGIQVEISGSMTPARLAKLPADPRLFVSMGFLTHQATWVDLAMDLRLLK